MADGFYTNDEPDIGCFGGYGSDGAWAYADGCSNDDRTLPRSHRDPVADTDGFGAFGSVGGGNGRSRHSPGFGGDFGRAA